MSSESRTSKLQKPVDEQLPLDNPFPPGYGEDLLEE